jgi:hypothetical protein
MVWEYALENCNTATVQRPLVNYSLHLKCRKLKQQMQSLSIKIARLNSRNCAH